MPDVQQVALDALRVRITRIFPEQIRGCLDQLTDEQIWWRPNEKANSVGNLVLHLAGSINHFLNRAVGGIDYQRDRPAEFAERGTIPKAQLRATFDDMVSKAERTFAGLTPESLAAPSPEGKLYTLVIEDLLTVAVHFSNHAGQIVWITKMLRESVVDDIWIRTHRELGGWRK
jgi:uncharacterized damage-inducible protein DinB